MKLRQEQVDKLREGKATLVSDHNKPEKMKKILGDFYPSEYCWSYYYKCTTNHQEWDACLESGINKYKRGELIPLVDFFEEEETLGIDYTNKAFDGITVYREPELIKAGDERVLLGMLRTPPKLDVRVVEEENYKLLIKPPKTAEERDQIVKELQAIEFKKELPSELPILYGDLTKPEDTLISLLRMRDVYRDGWVSDVLDSVNKNWIIELSSDEDIENEIEVLVVDWSWVETRMFSFQDEETAKLFLSNFKEELEQVKHLIS